MCESLSIVIPAYNEARCIENSLAEIVRFARSYAGRCEILVVDDGSTDDTASIVVRVQSRHGPGDPDLHLIRHEGNRGKGASVRTGFARATSDIVLFTDADLSAPISEAPRLIEPIAQGRCDVVIGSRSVDPSLIEVEQSVLRRASGRVFNWMVRRVTGLDIGDTQCGFKAFRRKAVEPAVTMQRVEGFAFDVELLYLAAKLGLRMLEVPVRWAHVHDSKVSLLAHSPQMFAELWGIRYRDWRGVYGESHPAGTGEIDPSPRTSCCPPAPRADLTTKPSPPAPRGSTDTPV